MFDVDDRGLRRVGVAVDVGGAVAHDLLGAASISARVASSFCWVAVISFASSASRCVVWSTCAVSWTSIAWFWLTWLASAANASGSGLGVVGAAPVDGGAVVEGMVVVVVVVVVEGMVVVVVVVVVVVDDSWANPAVAGTRNAVTSAPATSTRARDMARVSALGGTIVEPATPGASSSRGESA